MTGALMPQGADCVVMIENTSETDGLVRVTGALPAVNVRYRAEDVRSGDTVLRAGTRVTPAVVAMLASVGCDPVPVRLSCDGIARCVEYHGSGHIHAYGAANGIIVMPTGAAVLTEGTEIDVRLITA